MERKNLIKQLAKLDCRAAELGIGNTGRIAPKSELVAFMEEMKAAIFPEIYLRDRSLDGCLDRISAFVCEFATRKAANSFMEMIPEIKRLILTDVAAVSHNDPAVSNNIEVVVSYPSIHVMTYYRTAHALLNAGVKMIPRMLTEIAHSDTGIDINPAAQIGEYFAIDHGTGIVIGETCIIGNHVMLYQGVTLGAKNFQYSEDGTPLSIPRHPILEDNVTVYSNTSILGRVTIGHDTIIGGNIWLTNDVPPCSKITQGKAVYNDRV